MTKCSLNTLLKQGIFEARTMNDLLIAIRRTISDMKTDEIRELLERPDDWQPSVVKICLRELKRRNILERCLSRSGSQRESLE